jgi:Fe-S-cluster containining protein
MVVPPIKTEKGASFVGLKKDANGICIFYDINNKKCRIYSIRPNFCRTFPFSFRFENEKLETGKIQLVITEKGKEYCLGIDEKSPEIDLDFWLNLGKDVLSDLQDNKEFSEKWNKKEISPTAKKHIEYIIKHHD